MLRLLRFFLFLTVIALCAMRYVPTNLFAQNKIIVIVNCDVITQKDLDDFINFTRIQLATQYTGEELENKIKSIKSDLLDRLIEDRLILQEAKKSNIRIDENRVKARVDEIKRHYSSDREFQDALDSQGLVQADIETKIREQLLMFSIIDMKVRSRVVVNPSEITYFYQKNSAQFKLPEQKEFDSVAIEDRALAQGISRELKNGEDLQGLAEKYNFAVDKIRAAKNGQLRKDIEDIVFKLNKGEASDPIKIEDKYYIFRFDNIIPSRQQSLVEAQNTIYAFLMNKKIEETLVKWLDELKRQSYIKILQD